MLKVFEIDWTVRAPVSPPGTRLNQVVS